jgi:hypothetical protein
VNIVELPTFAEGQIINQIIRGIRTSLDLETIFNIAVDEILCSRGN